MKTVMLVDDERPARELLKMMIDWNKAGFEILCEARNGKQALLMYAEKKPDLIITDIQMPVMDGLEFLKKVKEICPEQKVVILSCHENFSYARQALRTGVADYLIKDALTEEVLYNLLESLNIPDSGPDSEQLSPDNLSSESHDIFCCLLSLEGFTALPQEWNILSKELENILNETMKCEVSVYQEQYLLVVCLIRHQNSQMELYNNRFLHLRQIRRQTELLTGCTVSIGVSSQGRDASALEQLTLEAFQALKSSVFFGTGKNLYYNPQYNKSQSLQLDTLNSQMKQLRASVEKSDEETVMKNLEQIYGKTLDGIMHYHYLNYVNALMIDILMDNCQKCGIPYETVFGNKSLGFDAFERMNTSETVLQWFRECFVRFFHASDTDTPQYSTRIRSILQYIQNNFRHDISLETIADTFWLHKVYLAKIFKQETGKSVNEYIRNIRIEKAKELLTDERIRISEIVTATGFNNPQSFYTIFKKYAGMTPTEYREHMQNDGP